MIINPQKLVEDLKAITPQEQEECAATFAKVKTYFERTYPDSSLTKTLAREDTAFYVPHVTEVNKDEQLCQILSESDLTASEQEDYVTGMAAKWGLSRIFQDLVAAERTGPVDYATDLFALLQLRRTQLFVANRGTQGHVENLVAAYS